MNRQPADFGTFYLQSRDGCLRAVYGTVGNLSLAEELVAEGFARAFASWRKVSVHPAPGAWVVRTALNLHISWWRRRRHETAWDQRFDRLDQAPAEPPLDAHVLAAVKALPLRQREVIALRVFMDLDTQDTAQALGIAPGTVKAHLSRAMATLRNELAARLIEEESR
ncbi:sigma-70 family RNA polymerase sigma factor [Actinospica durhamensis]|uniref:Sigma-70 family RNA polymerase sigma factor n=1 Tax=Actinospica durhamensis TaxID=1508375 RepID=A0A941EI63_9ACTN|nr:sigma-70 family RNA polymerase sigma factor [Actinospica durhamensis]MBR7831711.1 sigma-70 family RNA polymerase sigma factor [Actinospica durhamensis]